MPLRLLLDTHIAIRWITESKKLTSEQVRALEGAVRRTDLVALSAMTLLETAMLTGDGRLKLRMGLNEFFDELRADPVFHVLPVTYEVAFEAASLGILRDPADRAIVATARVRGLRLVTSDQRIIESGLVPVVV